jgi:hypothetical protein
MRTALRLAILALAATGATPAPASTAVERLSRLVGGKPLRQAQR